MMQTVSKLHVEVFARNVSQHPTSYSLLCIRSLLQALHTSNGYLVSFYAQCTDQCTVSKLACIELDVS